MQEIRQHLMKGIAEDFSNKIESSGLVVGVATKFLQLRQYGTQFVDPPVNIAWVFLALYKVMFERLAEGNIEQMGFCEYDSRSVVERATTRDIERLVLCSGGRGTKDEVGKIKKSSKVVLDLMIGVVKKCVGMHGGNVGFELEIVASELIFMSAGVAGMESQATFGGFGQELRKGVVRYLLDKLGEKWAEYKCLLQACKGGVTNIEPFVGGNVVSPFHIIAQSFWEEKDVTADMFEDTFDLPAGFVSNFAFPAVERESSLMAAAKRLVSSFFG